MIRIAFWVVALGVCGLGLTAGGLAASGVDASAAADGTAAPTRVVVLGTGTPSADPERWGPAVAVEMCIRDRV